VRLLYPWIALAAYLFFLAALAAGFLLVAAVPVAVGLVAAALIAAGQVYAFVRLLGTFVRLTFGSIATAGRLLRDLVAAVFGGEPEPSGRIVGAYGREALPEVFRLVDEVAEALRTRGVDRVLVTYDANCAVMRVKRAGPAARRRERVLVLGIPFLYSMSLDALRTVLGHELAHLALGHVRTIRMTWRFLGRIEDQLARMRAGEWWPLNPVYWAVALSHSVLFAVNLPWSRAKELEADRRSGRVLGANHSVTALRSVRDVMPGIELSLDLVARWCRETGAAPLHLGEAAYRVAATMPPALRKQLARRAEGDVLDFADSTHPPIALRIAALRGLPDLPPRHGELAARYLPDLRDLESHLTRVALRTAEQQPTREVAAQVVAALQPRTVEPA
jgi:Zn-dependent protease with chaperone function